MSPATAQLRQRSAALRDLLAALVDRLELVGWPEDLELDDLRDAAELHLGAACRACGCTDGWACEDGCHWVEDDLCSACEAVGFEVGFSARQLEALEVVSAALPDHPDAGELVHRMVDRSLADSLRVIEDEGL